MDFNKFKDSPLFEESPEVIEERKQRLQIAKRKHKFANLKKHIKSRRKRKKIYNDGKA